MITLHPHHDLGELRRIHGVNGAPVDRNWYNDQRSWFRHWEIPSVRIHDCAHRIFDTVDLHHLFPDPNADPEDPASYRFTLTDDLLKAIRDTGADIYFRLGESIEHQPTMMWGRPERWTPARMAAVCRNIVRHYNHGWAGGHEWGIHYWEFWNEPNGPRSWSGTPEQFFALYRAVAVELKALDPSLAIGLAGFSNFDLEEVQGDGDLFRPWREGIRQCAADGIPVDFVSWHRYLTSWSGLAAYASEIRGFLREIGLPNAESHLTEWAYRPIIEMDGQKISIFKARNLKRNDLMNWIVQKQEGPECAALILGTLAVLQDADIDLAHYYLAVDSQAWGLFGSFGVPAMRATAYEVFAEFLRGAAPQRRIHAEIEGEELAVIATREGDTLRVAIANLGERLEIAVRLPPTDWRVTRLRVLDRINEWHEQPAPAITGSVLRIPIVGAGIIALELKPGTAIEHSAESTSLRDTAEGDW